MAVTTTPQDVNANEPSPVAAETPTESALPEATEATEATEAPDAPIDLQLELEKAQEKWLSCKIKP